jgi:hypothetical protein
MRPYRLGDLRTTLADRQFRVRDRRQRGLPGCDERFGRCQLLGELAQLLGLRAAKVLQAPAESCGIADGQTIEAFT